MDEPLGRFMQGMMAAQLLLNKAIEKRSALECIVLQANLIDGALRIGLILKAQLNAGDSSIDDTLIAQSDNDSRVSERMVYKRCLESGVIDRTLFQRLSVAYDKRNKCIHRYLLSEIDYDFVTKLVFELSDLLEESSRAVGVLEQQQIEKGVGMTVSGPPQTKAELKAFAMQKEKRHNLDS